MATLLLLMLTQSACLFYKTRRTQNPEQLRKLLLQPEDVSAPWLASSYAEETKSKSPTGFHAGSDHMSMSMRVADAEDAPEFRHSITQYQSVDYVKKTFGDGYYDRPIEVEGFDSGTPPVNPSMRSWTVLCASAESAELAHCRFDGLYGRYSMSLYVTLDGEQVTQADFAELLAKASDKLVATVDDD